jgi:hypothetical protein
MSDELKACPFCGSDDIFNRDNGFGKNLTGCQRCGARVYYKFNSLEDAQIAWNARPIEDSIQARLEIAMEAMTKALLELGIPQAEYPAPVSNAWEIINNALAEMERVK